MGILFLLLTLIGVPLLEIAVFIRVGESIGLWPTLALVIATAVAGTWMLRAQGLAALRTAQASLDRGEFPVAQVFDGICLLLAGALLLTPGFVTDAVGLLLFVPAVRAYLRRGAWRYLAAHGEVEAWAEGDEAGPDRRGPRIIEGEFHEVPGDDDGDDEGEDTGPGP